jgi:hypothetical protein
MDARVSFDVNNQDRDLIEGAERHLLGGDSTRSAPDASRATTSPALQKR